MADRVTFVRLQADWHRLSEIGGMRLVSSTMVLVFDTSGGRLGVYKITEASRLLRSLSIEEGRELMGRWSPTFDDYPTMLGTIIKITAGRAPVWMTLKGRMSG